MADPKKIRVGVLFGGRSSEHEISLRSALTVMSAMDSARYEVVPIGIGRDGRWYWRADAIKMLTEAAPRLEALQAGLALAQAQNDVTVARGEATAARAELNALLAYPSDAAPSLADALDGGPLPSLDAATQQTIASNAELNVLQKRIEEAKARAGLARAMRRPDPSVMGALTYDAPGEFTTGWRVGANIALPIFTTGKADVVVADATVARAEVDRQARLAAITGAVAAALAHATAAHQTLDRYTTELLPASQQVEQMADESYRAGQTGLPAYLQTVQAARDVRTRALQAGLDYQLALAELERAMGTPLK